MLRLLIVTLGVALLGTTAAWGQSPSPPQGALWELQPDGDAIQKDLGFILPKKWRTFDRLGFTATREDGASVKTHYLSEDKALSLAILLQLRPDVRGWAMPADLVWSLIQAAADFEYAQRTRVKPTELSTESFSLGGRSPAGRSQWRRYDLESGAEVQGLWWQNIGIWSVVVTMSGPEARRAELEAHARTLFTEMPFPSAPIATEISVMGEKLFAEMPRCRGSRPRGAGEEIVPDLQEVALLTLLMPGLVLGLANDSLITPVTRAQDYCLIETFTPRKDLPVTAVLYQGPATQAWEARFGFALNQGKGGWYQLERMPSSEAQHVYLNYSNNKRASLYAVFEDWPSYEVAKKTITEWHRSEGARPSPILTMTNPAEKVLIVTGDRVKRAAE